MASEEGLAAPESYRLSYSRFCPPAFHYYIIIKLSTICDTELYLGSLFCEVGVHLPFEHSVGKIYQVSSIKYSQPMSY